MKKILLILVAITSIFIIRSFFLPWATVDTTALKALSEIRADTEGKTIKAAPIRKAAKRFRDLTYPIKKPLDTDIKQTVTGYEISSLKPYENLPSVVISFMELLLKDVDNATNMRHLVLFLPGGAILCFVLAILGLRFRFPIILMLVWSEATSIIGLYNIKSAIIGATSDFAHLTMEDGIWYSLYGFLFIFCISLVWVTFDKTKPICRDS